MKFRWQDWLDVLLGGWLIFSPWQLNYTVQSETATSNALGLGTVLVVFNLLSACRLTDSGQEILNILLGLWLINSPYALNFASVKSPTINTIVVGLMVVMLASWQLYDATKSGRK
jgi:hypothetical protein